MSTTSDYSVGITVGVVGGQAHVLDVVRVRLEYPDLRRRILREAARFKADRVLIEPSSSGIALLQDLRREGQLRPISLRAKGDKIVRLEAHSAKLEAGYVLIPERAPWLSDFKAELLAFPSSRHDDQVDALSQFLEWFSRHRRTNRLRSQREEGKRRDIKRREMPRRQDMKRRQG